MSMIVPNAARLQELREARSLSRRALAAEAGVDGRTIAAYESGEADDFAGSKLGLLADYFGVPYTDLLQTTEERSAARAAAALAQPGPELSARVIRLRGESNAVAWFAELPVAERSELVSGLYARAYLATPTEALA